MEFYFGFAFRADLCMHIGIIIIKTGGERRNEKEIKRVRECMHNLFIYELILKITAYKYFAYNNSNWNLNKTFFFVGIYKQKAKAKQKQQITEMLIGPFDMRHFNKKYFIIYLYTHIYECMCACVFCSFHSLRLCCSCRKIFALGPLY